MGGDRRRFDGGQEGGIGSQLQPLSFRFKFVEVKYVSERRQIS
jgi:hypothetical protein